MIGRRARQADQAVAAAAPRLAVLDAPPETLPWVTSWFARRCTATVEPNASGYSGRCELRRLHRGDHALERGMEIYRWSTRATRIQQGLW